MRIGPRPPSRIKEGPIAFADNSAAIRRDTAAILDSIVVFIRDRGGAHEITIEGHAEAYERDPPTLAAARAAAVRRYLVERGVPAGLFRPPGHGSDRLRELTGGDGGRDRRRVDLDILIPR